MLIIILVWLVALSLGFIYLFSVLFRVFKTKDRGLRQTILETLGSNTKLKEEIGRLGAELKETQNNLGRAYQKTAIVRFNPFERLGGEQSYCLAVINKNNSGVVLTFLYTKEGVRTYMKEVIGGEAKGADLSKEEKEAIHKAINTEKLLV